MSPFTSRRNFLRAAASGAAISSLAAKLPAAPPTPAVENAAIPVVKEIFPQHAELIMSRSAAERERIARSLAGKDARPLVVAAYQMANRCDGPAGKATNLARMVQAIEAAAEQKVQVLAFPELCLPGYLLAGTPAEAAEIFHSLADEPGNSSALDQLAAAAKQSKMVVAFGFCERAEGKFYNAIGLIDADGTWLGSRRKNPLSPHPHETEVFTEPDPAERTAVFKTRYVTLGLANCFDGEFPESIRRMRLAGAELLLWCNAGTGNPETGHSSRINASGCYAQANRMWVVCCNAVAEKFYGTSHIIGPAGEPLVVLPPVGEALAVATINLAQTADWDRWRLRLDPIWR
jgi:N-carbamoylputrescine amidase